jgi:hypothetical protein
MTREIKFRAWSKEERQMFNVGGLTNIDYPINHRYRYVTIAVRDAGVINDATPQVRTIELMQYTGLRDKNGKDAYEADLVRDWEGIDLYEVVWNSKWACFELNRLTHNNDTALDDMDSLPTSFEVVGNRYENPDLLEAPEVTDLESTDPAEASSPSNPPKEPK